MLDTKVTLHDTIVAMLETNAAMLDRNVATPDTTVAMLEANLIGWSGVRRTSRHERRSTRQQRRSAGHDRGVTRHERDITRHERDITRHERRFARSRLWIRHSRRSTTLWFVSASSYNRSRIGSGNTGQTLLRQYRKRHIGEALAKGGADRGFHIDPVDEISTASRDDNAQRSRESPQMRSRVGGLENGENRSAIPCGTYKPGCFSTSHRQKGYPC